jgi:hypothetical protein
VWFIFTFKAKNLGFFFLFFFFWFWSEKKFMGKDQWESPLQVPLIFIYFEKKCNCANLIGA